VQKILLAIAFDTLLAMSRAEKLAALWPSAASAETSQGLLAPDQPNSG